MEGGFGFPFGGDPDDLMRGLREFAERQTEAMQESQREQFATLTLNTAVELTGAALKRVQVEGPADEQAVAHSETNTVAIASRHRAPGRRRKRDDVVVTAASSRETSRIIRERNELTGLMTIDDKCGGCSPSARRA